MTREPTVSDMMEAYALDASIEWFLDTEVMPGNTVIGLKKDDYHIWPPAKVGKRLVNPRNHE